MINWNTTKEDLDVIDKIIERANKLGVMLNKMGLLMDISATHEKCPLKLQELLEADNFNFMHDVIGIINNINRDTGELENCFLPRFAK